MTRSDFCTNLFNILRVDNRDILTYDDINACVTDICYRSSPREVIDLALIIIHTRDAFAGKGERQLFYHLMRSLAGKYTKLAEILVGFIPRYGYWKDMWVLWHAVPELRDAIEGIVLDQFHSDQESETPSLLAKWLPREGSEYDGRLLTQHLATLLFPLTPINQRLRTYRRTCATLNRALNTTEVKMCANQWDTINPTQVPAVLMKNCKLAFKNKTQIKVHNQVIRSFPRSDNPQRVKCANNFERYFDAYESTFTPPAMLDVVTYTDMRTILDSEQYSEVYQKVSEWIRECTEA